ncbi:hypothetical protein BJV78DRAFT_1156901 [Lactifluus subvellereus]|nr:hypothetical protein BJV78DRAFT_1156901 [Lactifluus subvellereus]
MIVIGLKSGVTRIGEVHVMLLLPVYSRSGIYYYAPHSGLINGVHSSSHHRLLAQPGNRPFAVIRLVPSFIHNSVSTGRVHHKRAMARAGTYLHLRMHEMAIDYVRQNTDFKVMVPPINYALYIYEVTADAPGYPRLYPIVVVITVAIFVTVKSRRVVDSSRWRTKLALDMSQSHHAIKVADHRLFGTVTFQSDRDYNNHLRLYQYTDTSRLIIHHDPDDRQHLDQEGHMALITNDVRGPICRPLCPCIRHSPCSPCFSCKRAQTKGTRETFSSLSCFWAANISLFPVLQRISPAHKSPT